MSPHLATVLALAVWAGSAAADPQKLVEARAAIDRVAYTDAQPLLVEALQSGGAAPVTVIELYRLLATTATVLGQRDLAERYYRRWLALEPNAKLPPDISPKLRGPFVNAQVYMAARSPLTARAEVRGGEVDVVVASDPLAMVAAVTIAGANKPLALDHHAHAHLAAGAIADIVLLDEFGNHLVELTATPMETSSPAAIGPSEPIAEPAPVRRPIVWLVPAVAFGAAGGAFALGARSAQGQLDTTVATSGGHFYSDARAIQDRRDRDALFANLSFAAGGACAITAGVLYLWRPKAHVTLVPAAGGAAVAVRW